MQFDFLARWTRRRARKPQSLVVGAGSIPIEFKANPRARRYILRVSRDGAARVTIPRGGSVAFALEFARKQTSWIVRQLQQRRAEAARSEAWATGSETLLGGQKVTVTTELAGEILLVRFGDHVLTVPAESTDLRPFIERYLWSLADKTLRARTLQLAARHRLDVGRVVVRNQRSRWGSCSLRRTISLNWRLIQTPPWVQDYLILHELMHLREMNHSPRFWGLVQECCPDYTQAEAWLNAHVFLLR